MDKDKGYLRTPRQVRADEFDARVYSIMHSASAHAREHRDDRERWEAVAQALNDARARLRPMMHSKDIAEAFNDD